MKDFDLASVDHVLTTTKQVRRRLDLGRSVPVDTMLECIDIASRAPIGGNVEKNRWLIVDDPATKQSLSELYRAQGSDYIAAGRQKVQEMGSDATAKRVMDSANFLLENLHDVPMMVIPLRMDRPGTSTFEQATFWGSVIPGVWSLQLALRARGIGSAWTTLHLYEEQAAHDLLAARGKSPSSIGPINCKIRRQGNAWNSAWQSVSDQRDGKRNCLWQRVRFAA